MMDKIGWTDRVRNEEVLRRIKRRGMSYIQQKQGKVT